MTDEKELPDVWIDKPTRLTTDGVADAWTYPPGRDCVHYVPAARLDALRAELEAARADALKYADALIAELNKALP